ncbi:MAG: AMP-binding protein [Theionarchaea archaeon]|nr:AMP-binding protein [Theionarchaea archaeon]
MNPIDYKKEMKEFQWDVPETYDIASVVDSHARDHPSHPAILYEDEEGKTRTLTYHDLMVQSSKFANVLTSLGVGTGNPVLIMLPRIPETYIAQLGTIKTGSIITPAVEMLRSRNVVYRANDCQARAVITNESGSDIVDEVRSQLDSITSYILVDGEKKGWISYEQEMKKASSEFKTHPKKSEDIFYISYTSGTTGLPKGVVHQNSWMYAFKKINVPYWYGAQRNDVIWATTSPGWAKWFWTHLGVTMNVGATDLLYNGRFNPERYFRLLQTHKVTVCCLTPTELRIMIKVPHVTQYDLGSIRSFLSAGEPLNKDVIDFFREKFGITIREGYGQTETVCLVCNYVGITVKPGSMGKPMPGQDVRILNDKNEEASPGEVGEVTTKFGLPSLFKEYYKMPEKMKEVVRDGRYYTGDLCKMDEEGYYWFEGRADDVILSAGYRIGPFEVEDALLTHPAVLECAAVGSPHPDRGEIVKAFVVLNRGWTPSEALKAELQNHTKQVTAPYKYPREIEFVEGLPKTMSGKIKRAELKRMEYERKQAKE